MLQSGSLRLAGANTYTGATVVNGGTLVLGNATAIPAASAVTINGTGTLNLGGNSYLASSLSLAPTSSLTNTGVSATGTFGGLTATDSTSANSVTLASLISGSIALTKVGIGTLTLTNASNSFTGGISVNSGSVTATSAGALGSGATARTILVNGTFTAANAYKNPQLNLEASAAPIVLAAPLSLTLATGQTYAQTTAPSLTSSGSANVIQGNITLGAANGATGWIQVNSGTLTLSGSVTPAAAGRTLVLDGAANGELAGAFLDATFAPALVKLGSGTWVLSGANTYAGVTTISAGTLQIGKGGTSGALGSGAVVNNANLLFNRSDSYGAPVSAVLSGTGALTVANGILTLSGANTYSGLTTVAAGTDDDR